MNTLGWLGSILLAFCGLPELLKTLRTRRCSLSWGFLLMWGFGELFIIIPVVAQGLGAWLTLNYSVNIAIITILIYFKYKGRIYAD